MSVESNHSQQSPKLIAAQQLMRDIKINIKQLPTTELNYYLALLVASIANDPHGEKYIDILQKEKEFIDTLLSFYKNPNDTKANMIQVSTALEALVDASKLYTIPQKMKNALLGIVKITSAILMGFAGAILGTLVGIASYYKIVDKLYRKIFNHSIGKNDRGLIENIKGPGLGFAVGFAMGCLVGYRLPTKLTQNSTDTKIEFALDSLKRLNSELKDRKPLEQYRNETKQSILNVFFKDTPDDEKEEAFNNFLKEAQQFQVCSTTAGHISKNLKGHLGHHALIRFQINGVQSIPIEFGDRKKTPGFVDQSEAPRTVSGQKLFEMLTLDTMLQDTHKSSIKLISRYEIGSNDCLTYVNKILIGTGQNPTKMQRFSPETDTKIASKIVAPTITFFSRTQANELDTLIEETKEGELDIEQHTWRTN